MPRWMAVGTAQGWNDSKKFGEELHATHHWRPDARTSITTVYALDDGRLVAECSGVNQADFEAWLKQKNWNVESISEIKLVAKTGSIWEIK